MAKTEKRLMVLVSRKSGLVNLMPYKTMVREPLTARFRGVFRVPATIWKW